MKKNTSKASSSRAASLLPGSLSNQGFIGFNSFTPTTSTSSTVPTSTSSSSSSTPSTSTSTSISKLSSIVNSPMVAIESVDNDFQLPLRKLSKRDPTTKVKALNAINELLNSPDKKSSPSILSSVLPHWIQAYCRMTLDNDRRVRSSAHIVLTSFISIEKSCLAPHLKVILPYWLACIHDTDKDVRESAQSALNAAISSKKQPAAYLFASKEILLHFAANLCHTPQSLSDPKLWTPVEAADRYQRVISSTIAALSSLLELLASSVTADQFEPFFTSSLFKHATAKSSNLRSSVFRFVTAAIKALPASLISSHLNLIAPAVLNGFNDTNFTVHSSLWDATLALTSSFPEAWSHVDSQKTVFPRLSLFLKNGCYGSGHTSLPSLVLFLSNIPTSVVGSSKKKPSSPSKLLETFLNAIWRGLTSDALHPKSLTPIVVQSWAECLFLIVSRAEKLVGPDGNAVEFQTNCVVDFLLPKLTFLLFIPAPSSSAAISELPFHSECTKALVSLLPRIIGKLSNANEFWSNFSTILGSEACLSNPSAYLNQLSVFLIHLYSTKATKGGPDWSTFLSSLVQIALETIDTKQLSAEQLSHYLTFLRSLISSSIPISSIFTQNINELLESVLLPLLSTHLTRSPTEVIVSPLLDLIVSALDDTSLSTNLTSIYTIVRSAIDSTPAELISKTLTTLIAATPSSFSSSDLDNLLADHFLPSLSLSNPALSLPAHISDLLINLLARPRLPLSDHCAKDLIESIDSWAFAHVSSSPPDSIAPLLLACLNSPNEHESMTSLHATIISLVFALFTSAQLSKSQRKSLAPVWSSIIQHFQTGSRAETMSVSPAYSAILETSLATISSSASSISPHQLYTLLSSTIFALPTIPSYSPLFGASTFATARATLFSSQGSGSLSTLSPELYRSSSLARLTNLLFLAIDDTTSPQIATDLLSTLFTPDPAGYSMIWELFYILELSSSMNLPEADSQASSLAKALPPILTSSETDYWSLLSWIHETHFPASSANALFSGSPSIKVAVSILTFLFEHCGWGPDQALGVVAKYINRERDPSIPRLPRSVLLALSDVVLPRVSDPSHELLVRNRGWILESLRSESLSKVESINSLNFDLFAAFFSKRLDQTVFDPQKTKMIQSLSCLQTSLPAAQVLTPAQLASVSGMLQVLLHHINTDYLNSQTTLWAWSLAYVNSALVSSLGDTTNKEGHIHVDLLAQALALFSAILDAHSSWGPAQTSCFKVLLTAFIEGSLLDKLGVQADGPIFELVCSLITRSPDSLVESLSSDQESKLFERLTYREPVVARTAALLLVKLVARRVKEEETKAALKTGNSPSDQDEPEPDSLILSRLLPKGLCHLLQTLPAHLSKKYSATGPFFGGTIDLATTRFDSELFALYLSLHLLLSHFETHQRPLKSIMVRYIVHDLSTKHLLPLLFKFIALKGSQSVSPTSPISPASPVSSGSRNSRSSTTTTSTTWIGESVSSFVLAHIHPLDQTSMSQLCSYLYFRCLTKLPAAVRSWWTELDRATGASLEEFTKLHISPLILLSEIEAVETNAIDFGDLTLSTSKTARSFTLSYCYKDDADFEIVITLPPSYPLRVVDISISKRVGIAEGRWRKWQLSITTLLCNQDGSIIDAVLYWKKNVENFFGGVEECPICYSIVHLSDSSLPKLECRTCHNKFHRACLYKWFSTSHNSTCPLCRTPF